LSWALPRPSAIHFCPKVTIPLTHTTLLERSGFVRVTQRWVEGERLSFELRVLRRRGPHHPSLFWTVATLASLNLLRSLYQDANYPGTWVYSVMLQQTLTPLSYTLCSHTTRQTHISILPNHHQETPTCPTIHPKRTLNPIYSTRWPRKATIQLPRITQCAKLPLRRRKIAADKLLAWAEANGYVQPLKGIDTSKVPTSTQYPSLPFTELRPAPAFSPSCCY